MSTNIYMRDITTSTGTTSYVDISTLKEIELTNLDATNTITVAFGESTSTATEKITLAVKESGVPAYPVKLPTNGIGGNLYYTANANTPTLRITGVRY